MVVLASIFGVISLIGIVQGYYFNTSDAILDPASRQLFDYKKRTPAPDLLTTSAGQPVYITQTNTLNSNLLRNVFLLESLQHTVHERTPEREAFAKGAGAHGYFEVTNDVTKYTKAKLFEKVGKITPVVVRFGAAQVEKGSSDTSTPSAKGLAVKFYTEEGNFDLLGVNVPVFLFRDPIVFQSFSHALRPNPKTNLRDANSIIDFVLMNPESLHSFLWVTSEVGIPKGFRHMNSFPIHAFQLYNEHGQSYFVRFKWLSDLGPASFTLKEASAISSFDPDFFTRDLFNSIENQYYPSWTLKMDVLNIDIRKANFDPFDVTNLWPNGTYFTETIGRLVLNRNVKNYFAEVEQAAYNPMNLVPGIIEPSDTLFQGRIIAYTETQTYRFGINKNKININCPLYAKTYIRDGVAPQSDNEGDAVNYFHNSFHGPVPFFDKARPTQKLVIQESSAVDLQACSRFYNEVLVSDASKQFLVDNWAQITLRAGHVMQGRLIQLFEKVDTDLARRYTGALNNLKKNVLLPSVVDEVNKDNPNPFYPNMCR